MQLQSGTRDLLISSMRSISSSHNLEEFRTALFEAVEKLYPEAVITLNALGQECGNIYCSREGEPVHDRYSRELPELWPAQSVLLEVPPETDGFFATTLGRQKGSPDEADLTACREFYGKLRVDDAAALLLNHGHEYFGLLCVNTLSVPEREKTQLEEFLEALGPVVSSKYASLTRARILQDISDDVLRMRERAGVGVAFFSLDGVMQGASRNVLDKARSYSPTQRQTLKRHIRSWLFAVVSEQGKSGRPYASELKLADEKLKMQYLSSYGQATDYGWHMVEILFLDSHCHRGLSSREIEVADGVSQGLSDSEIGAELFISIHTVRRHVSRCLQKTGLTNRTELALWYKSRSNPLCDADIGEPS